MKPGTKAVTTAVELSMWLSPTIGSLSYDEFLERVITLASAKHYGFTPDDLKEKKGLKEFFGF